MHNSDDKRSTQHPKQDSQVDAHLLFQLLVARLAHGVMRKLHDRCEIHHGEFRISQRSKK